MWTDLQPVVDLELRRRTGRRERGSLRSQNLRIDVRQDLLEGLPLFMGITSSSSMLARACPASAASALGMIFIAPPHCGPISISTR
ncbi:MAG: hypothetical protein V2J89_07790 [Halieaceae bacterium]|nr:hypothetical protein [Halieaceae bacterium]